jgi:hypothetical protein
MIPLRSFVLLRAELAVDKDPFFTTIYTSCLIICASLKEICPIVNEELMPQDLEDVNMDGCTDQCNSICLLLRGIKRVEQRNFKNAEHYNQENNGDLI